MRDGRIVLDPDEPATRTLDADGLTVCPGFVDLHTHYDAQVMWDGAASPSPLHGVTTVVTGNCGFTIAPTRAEHHDVIVRTLENVEDMDGASLTEGIVWEFETFPQCLDLVRARGTVLNFSCYVGHSSVRLYAMGDDAYERYVEHWRRHHTNDGAPLSRDAFCREEQSRKWEGVRRCC